MTIYLASGNQHKKEEFVALFKKFHISTPADMKLTFAPQETGQTFLENALLKAHALYDIVHAPVIADDSGLCIDALDGKPGIYSARYGEKEAGVPLSAEKKHAYLAPNGRENKQDMPFCLLHCGFVGQTPVFHRTGNLRRGYYKGAKRRKRVRL